jgi:hypothetical protein
MIKIIQPARGLGRRCKLEGASGRAPGSVLGGGSSPEWRADGEGVELMRAVAHVDVGR